MAKRNHINEEQISELKKARENNKNKNIDKRLKALILHSQGKKRSETAKETEFAESYISELVSKYIKGGLKAIIENKQKGNHRNLSHAEEEELLESFNKKAQAGQIIEIKEIKLAYEEKIGRKLKSKGHIYYILNKHNWRKVMPRSKHPNKASDEVINTSKKLTNL